MRIHPAVRGLTMDVIAQSEEVLRQALSRRYLGEAADKLIAAIETLPVIPYCWCNLLEDTEVCDLCFDYISGRGYA